MKKMCGFLLIESTSKRVYGLDILRSIAILLVILEHSRYLLPSLIERYNLNFYLPIAGYYGVEAFFVLSGFLIGNILVKTFNRIEVFTFKDITNFWTRRWFRTLPNYILALLINIIIAYLLNIRYEGTFVKYFFFIQGFINYHPSFFAEAWSLAVEEWFYLILPVVLMFFSFLSIKKKEKILYSIVSIIIIFTVIRVCAFCIKDSSWDAGCRKITFFRLDAIAIGVLFSYIHYYHSNWFFEKIFLLRTGSVFLILLSSIWFFYGIKLNLGKDFFSKTFYFTIVDLSFALLLPYLMTIKSPIKETLMSKFLFHTSVISYSLYLYHYSVVLFLFKYIIDLTTLSNFQLGIVYISYVIVIYIVSTIIYKFFEKPLTDMRVLFSKDE